MQYSQQTLPRLPSHSWQSTRFIHITVESQYSTFAHVVVLHNVKFITPKGFRTIILCGMGEQDVIAKDVQLKYGTGTNGK